MHYNILFRNGEAIEIVKEIAIHMFQNKDGSINQRVLGMYVHELRADRVVQRDNKLLICKTVEDAIIIE